MKSLSLPVATIHYSMTPILRSLFECHIAAADAFQVAVFGPQQ